MTDGETAWYPESGQVVLDFTVSEIATKAGPIARKRAEAARVEETLSADEWYALGFDLEVTSPDEARDAYRRALELDPHHAGAHINLGRLLHEAGRLEDALGHYRLALQANPDDSTAAFDLAIARRTWGAPTRPSTPTSRPSGPTPSWPTRTSIWRGCTKSPASAPRRCDT
ncbi:MAG: tetratricopeptide repeat protein [Gemmatimonadetes bacterium]|nr:tetratricopeptide repeat protein [Gemmatimonadota bacterium]